MPDLTTQKCIPCEVGGEPLKEAEIARLLPQLDEKWSIENNLKIKRNCKFRDFKTAMQFVNRIAELAEAEGHHPDFHIHYNQVTIELWTHAVGGLSVNDFILAAKINQL